MLGFEVPYPDTLDGLAEALRSDPVVVHEALGAGDAAGADRRISELVGRLDFRAYVALVQAPDELDSGQRDPDLIASGLSRRIGEPGLYVVATPDGPLGIRLVGTGLDETRFSLLRSTNTEAVERASGSPLLTDPVAAETAVRTALGVDEADLAEYETPSLPAAEIEALAERERALQPYERPDHEDVEEAEPWGPGKRWMVGAVVGGGALVLVWQSVLGWPGWRRRAGSPQAPGKAVPSAADRPDLDQLRRRAGDAVTRLAGGLARSHAAPGDPHVARALAAREAAEPLLDSSDLLDVAGALTLARIGRRELERAGGASKPAYRPCFFDPTHGAGTSEEGWEFGDADVRVPVCDRCAGLLREGRRPPALRDGRRPYYEGRSVWARTGFGALTDDLPARVLADRREQR